MKKIITLQEAQALVSGTEERKSFLIEKMNAEIVSQSRDGKRWAHFPDGLNNNEELEFLKGELVKVGFTILDKHPMINW